VRNVAKDGKGEYANEDCHRCLLGYREAEVGAACEVNENYEDGEISDAGCAGRGGLSVGSG